LTIRELILELRKIANHDAMVRLESNGLRDIEAIEAQDHGQGKVDIVYLRGHGEKHGKVLSSTRRIVWPP
jgi:hypothetical protein